MLFKHHCTKDYLRCKDFESCVNTDGAYDCVFDYDSKCPNEKYKPQWKGVSEKTRLIKLKIPSKQ